ncbi:MAG: hypothetical protein ACI87W_001046, partial [Halieaceae bacterium]
GSALAGQDYEASAGNVVFAPGQTRQVVAVPILGDQVAEAAEFFSLLTTLSAGIDSSARESVGRAEILDDDTNANGPEISVAAGVVVESANASPQIRYTVTLSEPSSSTVRVDYASTQVGAGALEGGVDYFDVTGRLSFSAGETTRVILINIQDLDDIDEADESVVLALSNPENAVFPAGAFSLRSVGFILDDDGDVSEAGSLAFGVENAVPVSEGDTGESAAIFTAYLSRPAGQAITIAYTTQGVTATAGEDFTAIAGELSFAPGQQYASVAVPVLGDSTVEGDETFVINFSSSAAIASLEVTQAVGIILNDDSPVLISGDAGDNVLSVDEVADVIVSGGGGVDTVRLPLFTNEFTLAEVEPGRFEGSFAGRSIAFVDVEFAEFGSFFPTTIPLDDIVSGVAQDRVEKLSDLYLAFFGRAPDVSGLEYWQEQVLEKGRSFSDISADFAFSEEAQALFPAGASNREFVRNVYLNAFGREPDTEGWDFWTNKLDALGSTALNGRGSFVGELILGAYAPTSGADDRDLLTNRHDVALEYVNQLSLQPEEGFDSAINQLLELVSVEESTRSAAGEVIDYIFSDPITLSGALADTDYISGLFG